MVEGRVIPKKYQLLSVSINNKMNKIASASLVYQNGEAARGMFSLADEDLFVHGAKIEIKVGDVDGDSRHSAILFMGVVSKLKIKLHESKSPYLAITCRHHACAMSLVKRARYFESLDDQDIIEQLCDENSVQHDVQLSSSLTHEQIAQYEVSDWDFVLHRAVMSGASVVCLEDKIVIKNNDYQQDAKINLEFGATLLQADLETEARQQFGNIEGQRWDSASQSIETSDSSVSITETPGNTNAALLSDAIDMPDAVIKSAAQSLDELALNTQSMVDAYAANRVTGTLKTLGIEKVNTGDVVKLSGLSNLFNGTALVTGVRHEMDTSSGWRTYFQVGGIERPQVDIPDVNGLQIAKVVDIVDPANEYRVKVRLPMLDDNNDGIWARMASIDAGDGRGMLVRPEVDDEVVVGFIGQDLRQATILGMLHSSINSPAEDPTEENHIKHWVTRSGLELRFDDESKAISLNTPGGNKLLINDDDAGISLTDQNGNTFVMDDSGIQLDSATDFTVKASGNISIEAGVNLDLKAGAKLNAEGGAGSAIKSSAITEVKGALVKIN